MNNDELQKAIDDITRDSVAPAETGAADNEALANEMAGAPTKGEGVTLEPTATQPAEALVREAEIPAAPAPVVPEAPAMPPLTTEAPAAPAPQPAPTAAPAPEIVTSTTTVAEEVSTPEADLAGIEKEAMKELYPLLDKVQMEPEEKFEIYMKVAEDDKGAISGALNVAKMIRDETAKAEALLEIIEAVK